MADDLEIPDAVRHRIELEERYRAEVRAALHDAPEKGSSRKLWGFLNSSFGLWLLSAILVTGLGSLYTSYGAWRSAEAARRQQVERLDREISFRFSKLLSQLYYASQGRGTLGGDDLNEYVTTEPDTASLYAEFEEFSLLALVAELTRYVSGDDLTEIENVTADLTDLEAMLDVRGLEDATPKMIAGLIVDDFLLDRWRSGPFYFTACTSADPFC